MVGFDVATWNVHRFVGTDGRKDPHRALQVLQELDADVIALQEIECDGAPAALKALRHSVLLGPACEGRSGFGNALVTRLKVEDVIVHDLSVDGFEKRNVVDARLRDGLRRIRVLATHLGLSRTERKQQADQILEVIESGAHDGAGFDVTMVLGDLNVLDRDEGSVARLLGRFGTSSRVRSFPSTLPVLRLDRVLVDAPGASIAVRTHRTRLSRSASDHLPVIGSLRWSGPLPRAL